MFPCETGFYGGLDRLERFGFSEPRRDYLQNLLKRQ